MFKNPFVVPSVETQNAHVTVFEFKRKFIRKIQLKTLDKIRPNLVARAIFDVHIHAHRVVVNVLDFCTNPLLINGGRLERFGVRRKLRVPVRANRTRHLQAGVSVKRIAQFVLTQSRLVAGFGFRTVDVDVGISFCSVIKGVPFIQLTLAVIKKNVGFVAVKSGWNSNAAFELIILEKVFKIAFSQNTHRWRLIRLRICGVTVQAAKKQIIVQFRREKVIFELQTIRNNAPLPKNVHFLLAIAFPLQNY